MGKDKKKKEKDKLKKKQKSGKALKKSKEMLLNDNVVSQEESDERYNWHDWDDDDDDDDGMIVEPEDSQVNPELEEVPDGDESEPKVLLADTTPKPEIEQTKADSESETTQIKADNAPETTQIDTENVSGGQVQCDTSPVFPEKLSDAAVLVVFQALSDENRVKIMNLLAEREMCTSELLEAVKVVQSTMSHHMKVLCDAGLVSTHRVGKRSCYAARRDTLEQMQAYLERWKA
ncbi:MAG: metalloregulator ArsR/SmtB family transcription factor [Lachnospiraceae bacterium]|nr:metalloregulator ArsR/SmtB family transcription factor [Lachnospiraceae bacterium]